ncbi:MAG: OmpA family protein, partial [Pseudomonadota bacterium]
AYWQDGTLGVPRMSRSLHTAAVCAVGVALLLSGGTHRAAATDREAPERRTDTRTETVRLLATGGWSTRVSDADGVRLASDRAVDRRASDLYADASVYMNLKAWVAAKRLLRAIVATYPETPAAERARRDLAALERDDVRTRNRFSLGGPLPRLEGTAPRNRRDGLHSSRATPPRDDTPFMSPFAWLSDDAALQDQFRSSVGDRLFFGAYSQQLGSRGRQTLQAQIAWLKANPQVDVVVEAHADEPGASGRDNQRWSKARAQLIRTQLTRAGISTQRIRSALHGSEKPVALCKSAACRAQNRRVVLRLEMTDRPADRRAAR